MCRNGGNQNRVALPGDTTFKSMRLNAIGRLVQILLESDKHLADLRTKVRHRVAILEKAYQWETWAAPKGADGKLDHNRAMTGDDLREFVNAKLFPYLHGFKQKATSSSTLEYKIGEIFGEIKNKVQSGYNLRIFRMAPSVASGPACAAGGRGLG